MADYNTCSEWITEQIATVARNRQRVWFRDPDCLFTENKESLGNNLSADKHLLIVEHSLKLRQLIKNSLPINWVLIDHTREESSTLPLFIPDLRRLISERDHFRKTIRDFLVDHTNDPTWPKEVEAFPYRELARENPFDFIRAYDDFRAGTPTGFSAHDLVLIGASAVLGTNLFAVLDPFKVLEIAFHAKDKWDRLKEYFGDAEIKIVNQYLSGVRKPLGDLFGKRSQSARLATIALIILSRHLESPGMFLPNLSSSLSPFQDCDPIDISSAQPAWFQEEVDLFDTAVSEGFLKIIKTALNLDDPQKSKEFKESRPWSRKLRELVILEASEPTQKPASYPDFGTLEKLTADFLIVFEETKRIIAASRAECDRLRARLTSQLNMNNFLVAFRDKGISRLHIVLSRLIELRNHISRSKEIPPGFDDKWKNFAKQSDELRDQGEEILKDFDFVLGRFLESQYASVVPKQILPSNALIENRIIVDRRKKWASPLAIILLDGMRYDIWAEIIRPHLERYYSVQEEMVMALLPSETRISRVGFFSGQKPGAFFQKPIEGGEVRACQNLMKRLIPTHKDLVDWPVDSKQASFAFKTDDSNFFGIVLDFADALGHANAWEIDLLADMVQVWLKRLDQVLSQLPPQCEIWITSDHGQVISGSFPIDIPVELLLGHSNGYRSALIKERLSGGNANHVFYLNARNLGYNVDGFWAFPKPGYSFRLQDKQSGERSRFKPTANLRHSGLSAFEIFIPLARLTTRSQEVQVSMIVKPEGLYRVGVPGAIIVEMSANARIQGQIEITGDSDGFQPVIVQNVGTEAQAVSIPFTPVKAGTISITFEARWGFKNLPSPAKITMNIEEGEKRPITDALDEKLKKMFG